MPCPAPSHCITSMWQNFAEMWHIRWTECRLLRQARRKQFVHGFISSGSRLISWPSRGGSPVLTPMSTNSKMRVSDADQERGALIIAVNALNAGSQTRLVALYLPEAEKYNKMMIVITMMATCKVRNPAEYNLNGIWGGTACRGPCKNANTNNSCETKWCAASQLPLLHNAWLTRQMSLHFCHRLCMDSAFGFEMTDELFICGGITWWRLLLNAVIEVWRKLTLPPAEQTHFVRHPCEVGLFLCYEAYVVLYDGTSSGATCDWQKQAPS